jgi:hypothetical protein
MKFRTSVVVVAVAAAASWMLPGTGSQPAPQVAHEFLTSPATSASAEHRVEPVQLALLFQGLR